MEISKALKISSRHYKTILKILNNHNGISRLIGGCVRDAILGKNNPDIDIATSIEPKNVIKILALNNIKTVPTGIKFGTVSAIFKGEKFEITTLRKDLDCNGRHAKVIFTADFETDAQRRDFTINALSYCPFKKNIYDYFNGFNDLLSKKVYFIGNAEERIKEDYLRILRFFRFSTYYAKNLDKVGFDACIKFQEGLKLLSAERIKWEMDKIISSNQSPIMLNKMFEMGILFTIFNIKTFDYKTLDAGIKLAEKSKVFLSNAARFAICFFEFENLNYQDLLKLKFIKKDAWKIINILNSITNFHQDKQNIIMQKIWLDSNVDFSDFIICLAVAGKIEEKIAINFINQYLNKNIPIFPINGHDVQKLGFETREIKSKLKFLRDKWIESGYTLSYKDLIESLIE